MEQIAHFFPMEFRSMDTLPPISDVGNFAGRSSQILIPNIWAVARNYSDHAAEMNSPKPTEPIFFLKSGSCAFYGTQIELPSWSQDVHHEIEIAVQLGANLEPLSVGLAIDLTERHFQGLAKAKSLPWTLAKSFPRSCPLTRFVSLNSLDQLEFRLWVNQELRQSGKSSDMIFGLPQLLEFAKHHFPVQEKDLLLTGTPAGVGRIQRGDKVRVELTGHFFHEWQVI